MLLGLVSNTLRESARNVVGKLTPTMTAGLRFYSLPYPQGLSEDRNYSSNHWGFLINASKSKNSKDAGVSLDPEAVWKQRELLVKYLPRPPGPYSGRSVACSEKEIGMAFGKLQAILRSNNVIAELRRAERHEKKGVKRRRLRSERWRRRFAHEVRKKVQLVNEIRARGA